VKLPIQILPHADGLPLPFYGTQGAAGFDLIAAIPADEVWAVAPGETRLIPCGFCTALPPGHELQVRPRSGLALKHSVTVLNSPGTVDSDYRGEIGVILINHGKRPFEVRRGYRIAQGVIARHETVAWEVTQSLPASERGEAGYGSTGVNL